MKSFALRLALLAIFCGFDTQVCANQSDTTRLRRWYLPHYVPVQFAGNIGFLSTGVGYNSNKMNYHLDLLYGYVPESRGGVTIHTITAKNYLPLARYLMKNNQTLIPYIGLGLSIEVGGNSFFIMPSHFPESYYDFPKNLHVLAYGGARLQRLLDNDQCWIRGIEFYAEGGAVDVYLWYKTMSDHIKFPQVFSLALGVNLILSY